MRRYVAPTLLAVVAILLTPLSPVRAQKAGAAVTGTTLLTFRSDVGDYIGQGLTQTWTPTNGSFTANHNANLVSISYNGGPTSWSLNFKARSDKNLIPGPYEGATRYPFQSPTSPGLDVSGSGRGCNTLTGRFDVLQAVYAADGSVSRFAADFEQHCEGGAPALQRPLQRLGELPRSARRRPRRRPEHGGQLPAEGQPVPGGRGPGRRRRRLRHSRHQHLPDLPQRPW